MKKSFLLCSLPYLENDTPNLRLWLYEDLPCLPCFTRDCYSLIEQIACTISVCEKLGVTKKCNILRKWYIVVHYMLYTYYYKFVSDYSN